MAKKTILFTGCTDGIGLDAVRQLVGKGHRVLMHGRSPKKLAAAAAEIGVPTEDTFVADLSSMKQVYQMVNQIKSATLDTQLDCLVNNAGVFKLPAQSSITEDGIDIRFAVNMVAPYIITKELLPITKKHGRIINVSSAAQAPIDLNKAFGESGSSNGGYADFDAYAQSKLGIMMWTNVMAVDHPDQIFMSLNPASMIGTKMVKEGFGVASGKDIRVGSDILVQTTVGTGGGKHNFGSHAQTSGKYFDNDRGSFGRPHPDALDEAKSRILIATMDQWLATTFES